MSDPLSKRLRDLAAPGVEYTVNQLLDMARDAEIMEDNLSYLLSVSAATATEQAARRTTAKGVLLRHQSIIKSCQIAARGGRMFRSPLTLDQLKARLVRSGDRLQEAITEKEMQK